MRLKTWLQRGTFMLITAFSLIMVTGCAKKESNLGNDELLVSPIISPSGEPTIAPTPIAMTPAPGVTLTPTPEPTKEPTPTPVVYLTKEEGETKVKEKVDTSIYSYQLMEQALELDGNSYFVFKMFQDENIVEPYILVDRATGELCLYDMDGNLTPFTKFPIDASEKLEEDEYEVSMESALEILKKIPKEKLGLLNSLSHYTIIADEWTTIVNTDVCYCFNIYEGSEEGQLVACYYVSTLGTAVYTFDEENGEFIRCD